MNEVKKSTRRIGRLAFVLVAVHLLFSLAIDYTLSSGAMKDPTLFITMERISYVLLVLSLALAALHGLAIFLDPHIDGFQVFIGLVEAAYFCGGILPAIFIFQGLFVDPGVYQKILANSTMTFLMSLGLLLGVLVVFLHLVHFFFFKDDEPRKESQ